jgi:peptidoglycan/LPS O-acetylase OafA/YrhL
VRSWTEITRGLRMTAVLQGTSAARGRRQRFLSEKLAFTGPAKARRAPLLRHVRTPKRHQWRITPQFQDPKPPRPVAAVEHRNDLQGLRAVAVLMVALGHAGVGFLKGGYVGVDVFFVLSGFLITGLLLSSAAKHGSISLTDFYIRRARRILPAAALTLVVTVVVAYWLLNFVRAKQAVWDSLWASVFAANIHFAEQGTDYFAQGQPPSPVEHFWSLAVEEQFYLVWPAVLSLVLFGAVINRRSPKRARMVDETALRRLLVVVLVAAIASLVWSIYYTDVNPTPAYFSTFARTWELAIGAALAVGTSTLLRPSATSRVVRFSQALRVPMGWVGLIGIACAGVMFSGTTPFPGSAALLPTLGTALVIGAGIGDRKPRFSVGRLLALAPMRYVGDRSYAFYLWHWPVLIIASEYAGHDLPVRTTLLLLAGAFLLSVITYALYENPIRRARWSAPASAMLWPSSVAVVVFVSAFTLEAINDTSFRLQSGAAVEPMRLVIPGASTRSAHAESSRAVAASAAGRPLPGVVAAVKAARRGAAIPSGLTPPVAGLEEHENLYLFPGGCSDSSPTESTSKICRLGDASSSKTIVVIGDSHAQMWMPAILRMAERDGWAVLPVVKSACIPNTTWTNRRDFGIDGTRLDAQVRVCRAWFSWALRQVKALHPDVTLIAGASGGARGHQAEAIKRGFISLTTAAKSFSKDVVVVADTEGIAQQPVDCLLGRHATMGRCTTTWSEERFYFNNDLAAFSKDHEFRFIKTRGWFCFELQCPTVIGHTIVYRDTGHLTKAYAQELAEPFRASFKQAIRFKNTSAKTSGKIRRTRASA